MDKEIDVRIIGEIIDDIAKGETKIGTLYMSKGNIKKIEESKELQEKTKQWNNSKIDTLTFVMAISNYKKEKQKDKDE